MGSAVLRYQSLGLAKLCRASVRWELSNRATICALRDGGQPKSHYRAPLPERCASLGEPRLRIGLWLSSGNLCPIKPPLERITDSVDTMEMARSGFISRRGVVRKLRQSFRDTTPGLEDQNQ